MTCWLCFNNNKWGSQTSFLSYEQLKPKQRVYFTGSLAAMVTYYVKIINESYLAMRDAVKLPSLTAKNTLVTITGVALTRGN